ncbi:MAG: ArnT family glycosyltransferase [Gemmatimonadaceae bacterium]
MTLPLPPIEDERTFARQAMIVLLVSTLVRLFLAAIVPVFPDEAYYWEWSRRLAGGYFDHPPMIAVLIAGGTAIFGDSPIGVRILPVLAGGSAGLAIALSAWELAGARAARYAAYTFAVLPLAAAGLILATPDAPLLAAITWTLYAVVRALGAPAGSAASTRWWLVGGFAIGVAMASKFTGVFVPFALLCALVLHAPLRARFREPGPYLAVFVASVVMVPVLMWNESHDWIAFRFQLGHGLGTSTRESLLQRELNLVGGQLALVTPILFGVLIAAVMRALRAPREDRRFALATIATFCALFFVYSATRRNVEANWPAIAWIPALVVLAASRTGSRSVWEWRGVALAGVLSIILLVQVVLPFLPLPARRDPVSLAHGWDTMARYVDSARTAHLSTSASTATTHLAANRYQDAAMLALHLPTRDSVTALNLGGRRNQYDLWTRFTDRARAGDDLLVLLEIPRQGGVPGPIRRLDGRFAAIDSGPIVSLLRDGEEVGRRRLWTLTRWNGTWPVDSTDPRAPRTQ